MEAIRYFAIIPSKDEYYNGCNELISLGKNCFEIIGEYYTAIQLAENHFFETKFYKSNTSDNTGIIYRLSRDENSSLSFVSLSSKYTVTKNKIIIKYFTSYNENDLIQHI